MGFSFVYVYIYIYIIYIIVYVYWDHLLSSSYFCRNGNIVGNHTVGNQM